MSRGVGSGARGARLAPLVALAATLVAGPARADNAADEKAAAKLFREGREALERGDLATGCPRLAASLEKVRRSGTLFNLAICEEKAGHLIKAHALVEEGIRLLPGGDDRLKPSRRQADELDARIPRLTLALAPDAPAGTAVERDGERLAPSALGAPQRVDPGAHVVVVSAPGRPDQRTSVELRERDRKTLSLSPAPAVAGTGEKTSGSSGMRVAGWVVGGVGLATFGAGIATGLLTNARKNEVEENCRKVCNDAARDAASAGKTLSLVSTVTFVGGLALVGAGIGLVVAGYRSPRATALVAPSLLPGGGGLTIAGRFR